MDSNIRGLWGHAGLNVGFPWKWCHAITDAPTDVPTPNLPQVDSAWWPLLFFSPTGGDGNPVSIGWSLTYLKSEKQLNDLNWFYVHRLCANVIYVDSEVGQAWQDQKGLFHSPAAQKLGILLSLVQNSFLCLQNAAFLTGYQIGMDIVWSVWKYI